jgi:hypothetical protein
MIATREIIANVAKLIRIISGVGPNNQTRPPISTATTRTWREPCGITADRRGMGWEPCIGM